MKPSDILTDKTTWTQDRMARDSDGEGIDPDDSRAVCFCAAGAIAKVHGLGTSQFDSACYTLAKHLGISPRGAFSGIVRWNDDTLRSFDEVRTALVESGL